MDSLSQSVEWLTRNPWFMIAAFLVSVAALISGYIFYRKSKKAKLPRYTLLSFNIVRNLVSWPETIQMLYSGQRVDNLTVTKLVFWNAGSETINRQDISNVGPLIFRVKEGHRILDAKITYMNNPANQFSVTIANDQSHLLLNFDYIDKNQGVVIQLFHTGQTSEDIECHGSLKGVGKPIRKFVSVLERTPPPFRLSVTARRRLMALVSCFFGIVLISLVVFSGKSMSLAGKSIFVLIVLILTWLYGFYTPRRTAPKEFDVFEEEFFKIV